MSNNLPKPWERRQANGRITAVRNRRRVLILCEDSKSARLYFEGFKADYGGRLSKLLKCKYDKADDQIYARLESLQPTAMKSSRRLKMHWVEVGRRWPPEDANPSTNIHELVEFLNAFKEIGPADAD
jgi:hypothetical protein